MTQYIKKLPAVFQTVTEKKFFDATFDQVLSKRDSELLAGYLGRRNPGSYNPINDFYLPEPSKNRTWWQLEATAFSRREDSTKSNIFFYEDLLNKIESLGGNTLNQDRLFESEYYSFAPPIDFDMFLNYQNYYWIEQGLPTITISGVMSSDIIGQSSFVTPDTANPPNLKLTTGMTISLLDDPEFRADHIVENIGGCTGIRLVPRYSDFTSGAIFEYLPWDNNLELSTGRIIRNSQWDTNTWEIQTQPSTGDYITIERGSLDRNAWSRTNKWFHIEAINQSILATGSPFPVNSVRALRPIIQFVADLELWKSGTQFLTEIKYGFKNIAEDQPIRYIDISNQPVVDVNSALGISLQSGDLIAFFADNSQIGYDILGFDEPPDNWDETYLNFNKFIFRVVIDSNGRVQLVPYTSWFTPVSEGDIVFVLEDGPFDSAQRGQTWYYENNSWQQAENDKIFLNQAPLFKLFDHTGTSLDDQVKYPGNTFSGSKIFSYKVNSEFGARIDPILKFPLVYKNLGQITDIVFENDLMTVRYEYGNRLPIDGYYYYKITEDPNLYTCWNLYDPCFCEDAQPENQCLTSSKQRVIDRYVVGYGVEFDFELSVEPLGWPADPDMIVTVNGLEIKPAAEQINGYTLEEINNKKYVVLDSYLSNLLITPQNQPPVVEIQSYTHGILDPLKPGYFEIPQQLEANPNQLEVFELSSSDLVNHFSSIISSQFGISGIAFGGNNNYRDTKKNRTLGKFILQNVSPLLKTMLVSSESDLDVITATRFSQDEYVKFKNRYVRVAQQLIEQEFSPVQVHFNNVVISRWVDEILRNINISKEFSDAFAYSYMIANGSPVATETFVVTDNSPILLNNFVDLSKPENAVYFYDTTGQERLLTVGVDYEFVSTNLVLEVRFNVIGNITAAFYQNPIPAYIASTPSKLGMYPVYRPRIAMDTSYASQPQPGQSSYPYVIIGHDGSKTMAYSKYNELGQIIIKDYRDDLLLELETRIYNLIQEKFRNQHYYPLRLESIKSGYFRETRYSRDEFLGITESYLNKWSAKNRANYRTNNWAESSSATDSAELWKLYNYSRALNATTLEPLNLPGNWKGIYQYCYDTIYPNTRPWEMFGITEEPSWWRYEYGNPIINSLGEPSWPSTAAGNSVLWDDIESGIIRQGASAVYDPFTGDPVPQKMWSRPGVSAILPVDTNGDIRSIVDIFDVLTSGNPLEPFDGYDDDWVYGDGGPVEQAWMNNSGYAFSVQEFFYLMRPASFGEYYWDTAGTDYSPGMISVAASDTPVRSNQCWQYVQNDVYNYNDQFSNWMRPRNKDQIVHAEPVNGEIAVRFGYQRWISDRILFLGKSVGSTFGQKIRTVDVNLANKLAGFTNKDTTNTYIESNNPSSGSSNLIIPSNNFDVVLHKSPIVGTYAYSGIVIRALDDGSFAVYGYDLLNSEFVVFDRSDQQVIDITVGGTPAEFLYFTPGATYKSGDIVRYNGVYYESKATQTVQKFNSDAFIRLKSLPIIGGVSVSYKPIPSGTISKIPYGSILKTPQEVVDLMIGWEDFLKSQGWRFDEVNPDTNQLSDWLFSARQFLFWLNSIWAPDASIQLSPLANRATFVTSNGYPNDVETISNGVYSILDKFGASIPPINTATDREGQSITVTPSDLSAGGIYFLMITTSETEHVLIFDNTTSFNDVIYSPLLRSRQQRLRFNGFRSRNWFGKMEAPGYLIIDNQMVPNYDTIVDSMRYYYDPNVTIDNPSLEDLGRSLIGYENKSYLDNLEVSNDVQYLFYQGYIRQKGTNQAFDKLFRSNKVQTDEIIEVYEEWALKLADFGNTVEQVETEFILKPEQNSGEVIVARLNYKPSPIGFVKQINILNAENQYRTVPTIVISPPTADIDPALLRQARAYAVLDSSGRISRVDVSDPGFGYTSAPDVAIISQGSSNTLDRLYAVWQGEILHNPDLDNVIDIDIDDVKTWVVRPNDPELSLEFPLTDQVEYSLPNAGYVNFNDVDLHSFDVSQTAVRWGTDTFNPELGQTLWVAKNFTEDWAVYKLIDVSSDFTWDVVENNDGTLSLRTLSSDTEIVSEMSPDVGKIRTDFGNLLIFQSYQATATTQLDIDKVSEINLIAEGSGYLKDPVVIIDPPSSGVQAEARARVLNGRVISLEITNPGSGYTVAPNVTIGLPDIETPIDNYTLAFRKGIVELDPGTGIEYQYYDLLTLDGLTITADQVPPYRNFVKLGVYKTMRFETKPVIIPDYIVNGDLLWIDDEIVSDDELTWAVVRYNGTDLNTVHRRQEKLIDTRLFTNASIFAGRGGNKVTLLPVYDPFKDILPGPARQNITYISMQDPARYNITDNPRLRSENIIFADQQVGQLWWDTSSARYVYYEQPQATDETANDNLVYRRNQWGRLFPGSTVEIYEWTRSSQPPVDYTGPGIPRDINSYVQVVRANRIDGNAENTYYFWVLNTTDVPNRPNRTLPAAAVSRLLESPRSQGFEFFAPIQQTDLNNSYMFFNVQNILAYRANNVQIRYRLEERNDQAHAQWQLFREGETKSVIPDSFWNKMTDSLAGYSQEFELTDEFEDSVLIYENRPWDTLEWDRESWDVRAIGEVLPVPDPTLSSEEKYGIEYRPRQSMFVNLLEARRVFVQAANELLSNIPIRDTDPLWDIEVNNRYWSYINWYKPGYEGSIPNVVFQTLAQANDALGQGQLSSGDIVQITEGTPDGRFTLYAVVQLNPNINVLSLEEIGIQNSAIRLSEEIYSISNVYPMAQEIRQLLNAFRTRVMVNEFEIDQNLLFFSMVNYVLSEQKNPNWVFKTSYIYVKENNVPLVQKQVYAPNQIDSIIKYIEDAKPYHTKVREYASAYTYKDLADGTAIDDPKIKASIKIGVNEGGHWDTSCRGSGEPGLWDIKGWESCSSYQNVSLNSLTFLESLDNFVSGLENLESYDDIAFTMSFDSSKKGLSTLYPYTVTIPDSEILIPELIVAVWIISSDNPSNYVTLKYGNDYRVEKFGDEYIIYLFTDPNTYFSGNISLKAFVWFDGGSFVVPTFVEQNSNLAAGTAADVMSVNVDTQLPVLNISDNPDFNGAEIAPLVGWGEYWDAVDSQPISDILLANNGITEIPWDVEVIDEPLSTNITILDDTISFKQFLYKTTDSLEFYRNSENRSGILQNNLPMLSNDNVSSSYLIVSAPGDIFPSPTGLFRPAVWIEGERITYGTKVQISPGIWKLGNLARGSAGTSTPSHDALNRVWIENGNYLPINSKLDSWNKIGNNTTTGGLWYSTTNQALFLKNGLGKAID